MSGAIAGRGAAGPQGPAGPAGQSATINVGTVSAMAADSPSATVQNVGTQSAAVLQFSFGLPKGDKGDTGQTGAQGPTGPVGPLPVFGPMAAIALSYGSSPSVSVAGDGTSGHPLLLTFGIPQGQPGATGAPPQVGAPTASSVSPGGIPTVNLTGSGTAMDPLIFNFGIPTGATGSQGPTGPAGPQGPSGPQGPAGADAVSTDPLSWLTIMRSSDSSIGGYSGNNRYCTPVGQEGQVSGNNLTAALNDMKLGPVMTSVRSYLWDPQISSEYAYGKSADIYISPQQVQTFLASHAQLLQ